MLRQGKVVEKSFAVFQYFPAKGCSSTLRTGDPSGIGRQAMSVGRIQELYPKRTVKPLMNAERIMRSRSLS